MVTNIRAAAAASQKRFIDASFTRLTPPSTAFSYSQTEPGMNMFGSVEQLRDLIFTELTLCVGRAPLASSARRSDHRLACVAVTIRGHTDRDPRCHSILPPRSAAPEVADSRVVRLKLDAGWRVRGWGRRVPSPLANKTRAIVFLGMGTHFNGVFDGGPNLGGRCFGGVPRCEGK
jgi:hypothetical protein